MCSTDKPSTGNWPALPVKDVTSALVEQMQASERAAGVEQMRALSAKPQPYAVGPGDVLQITVWDHPELAAALGAQPPADARTYDPPPGFVVDDNGNLSFPYAGQLPVDGLSVEHIQSRLAERLSKSFNDPQVTVRVASYRSKQIYVDGDVHTPGAQFLNDVPVTLYDAISHAGGFESTADQSRIALVRDGRTYRIDLTQLLGQGGDPGRLYLQRGDFVRVAGREDNGVFVIGEVSKPVKALPLRNGRLTLSEALSQAGSFNLATSNTAQLYVVRGRGKDAEVFHLDASSPVSMVLANQFDLEPQDVVYVDAGGLVRFNRVLSLLLPAIDAGLTAGVVAK
jgi:polysaccharide biosynthesis/export protein